MARMHAHGFGLDDGTQVKATKAGQQFGDDPTDDAGAGSRLDQCYRGKTCFPFLGLGSSEIYTQLTVMGFTMN